MVERSAQTLEAISLEFQIIARVYDVVNLFESGEALPPAQVRLINFNKQSILYLLTSLTGHRSVLGPFWYKRRDCDWIIKGAL